jgi:hypothetical protein
MAKPGSWVSGRARDEMVLSCSRRNRGCWSASMLRTCWWAFPYRWPPRAVWRGCACPLMPCITLIGRLPTAVSANPRLRVVATTVDAPNTQSCHLERPTRWIRWWSRHRSCERSQVPSMHGDAVRCPTPALSEIQNGRRSSVSPALHAFRSSQTLSDRLWRGAPAKTTRLRRTQSPKARVPIAPLHRRRKGGACKCRAGLERAVAELDHCGAKRDRRQSRAPAEGALRAVWKSNRDRAQHNAPSKCLLTDRASRLRQHDLAQLHTATTSRERPSAESPRSDSKAHGNERCTPLESM